LVKRHFFLVLLIFSVAGTLAGAQTGWFATPGQGVGAVTVGMTSQAAEAVLVPSRVIGKKNNPLLIEYGEGVAIEYSANEAVIISLHKNSFNTKNGPVSWSPYKGGAVGASWNSVAPQLTGRRMSRDLPTAKGYPPEVYHAYPDLGIGFWVKGGTVTRVDLFQAK
jgi:hypothetical protein